jgi:hypothetical protein
MSHEQNAFDQLFDTLAFDKNGAPTSFAFQAYENALLTPEQFSKFQEAILRHPDAIENLIVDESIELPKEYLNRIAELLKLKPNTPPNEAQLQRTEVWFASQYEVYAQRKDREISEWEEITVDYSLALTALYQITEEETGEMLERSAEPSELILCLLGAFQSGIERFRKHFDLTEGHVRPLTELLLRVIDELNSFWSNQGQTGKILFPRASARRKILSETLASISLPKDRTLQEATAQIEKLLHDPWADLGEIIKEALRAGGIR